MQTKYTAQYKLIETQYMQYGTYLEPFPRGWASQGWDPQNPTKQTLALPVEKHVDVYGRQEPDFIWAGMIISPTADGTHWHAGVSKDAEKDLSIIAVTVQDCSTDKNIMAADSLVGLLCTDKFTIASPFFARNPGTKEGDSFTAAGDAPMYTTGTKLTYCKEDEVDERTNPVTGEKTYVSLRGWFRPAKAGETVIGVVADRKVRTGINGSQSVSTATSPSTDNSVNGAEPLQQTWGTTTYSHCRKENAYVVHFVTAFQPANPTA